MIWLLKTWSFNNFNMPLFNCSIEFDRDDELFATAGVSRRIKVFDFSSVSLLDVNVLSLILLWNNQIKIHWCYHFTRTISSHLDVLIHFWEAFMYLWYTDTSSLWLLWYLPSLFFGVGKSWRGNLEMREAIDRVDLGHGFLVVCCHSL